MRAFVRLTGAPTSMSAEDACKRLNRLPWSMTEENLEKWQRVLWNGGRDGKIITKNRKLATALIAHAAGGRITDEKRTELLNDSASSSLKENGSGICRCCPERDFHGPMAGPRIVAPRTASIACHPESGRMALAGGRGSDDLTEGVRADPSTNRPAPS